MELDTMTNDNAETAILLIRFVEYFRHAQKNMRHLETHVAFYASDINQMEACLAVMDNEAIERLRLTAAQAMHDRAT